MCVPACVAHVCSRQGPRINLIDLQPILAEVTVVSLNKIAMLLIIITLVYPAICNGNLTVAAELFCAS